MNAKVGQVLVAMKDQSAGGFMAPKQDVTGIGEAEVLELLAKSGRPLVLSFKAAGGAAAASPVALAGASVLRPVAIAEGNSGAGPSAKQAGGGFGLGGAVTSPAAGPRDHTHTHAHLTRKDCSVCFQPRASGGSALAGEERVGKCLAASEFVSPMLIVH